MALSKKQIFIIGGIATLGVGAYFLFKNRKLEFYDNVWCGDDECSNIDDIVAYCSGNTYDSNNDGIPDSPPPGGGRALPPEAAKGITACINSQSNADADMVKQDQIDLGIADADGKPIGSEAEIASILNETEGLIERQVPVGLKTGMFNIIFPEPHNLKEGEVIYVQQDIQAADAIPSYNGKTVVTKVYNDYIIATDKPRIGNTSSVGGIVTVPSMWERFFS